MRISELIKHLEALQEDQGDLECAVYADVGIQPVQGPKVHALQDFDFGYQDFLKTGTRIALLWERPPIP